MTYSILSVLRSNSRRVGGLGGPFPPCESLIGTRSHIEYQQISTELKSIFRFAGVASDLQLDSKNRETPFEYPNRIRGTFSFSVRNFNPEVACPNQHVLKLIFGNDKTALKSLVYAEQVISRNQRSLIPSSPCVGRLTSRE